MASPQEPDPDLDDLTRDRLAELTQQPELLAVHDALGEWFGVMTRSRAAGSDNNLVGTFLEELADRGYRVDSIDDAFARLIPPPTD